jgi:hypothetical protein
MSKTTVFLNLSTISDPSVLKSLIPRTPFPVLSLTFPLNRMQTELNYGQKVRVLSLAFTPIQKSKYNEKILKD